MTIRYDHMPLVQINLPEMYDDPAFQTWLNDPSSKIATWHETGKIPGDYSDIFISFCAGEGSNSDMPEHCWEKIKEALGKGWDRMECLIWLTNLEE